MLKWYENRADGAVPIPLADSSPDRGPPSKRPRLASSYFNNVLQQCVVVEEAEAMLNKTVIPSTADIVTDLADANKIVQPISSF